MANITKYICAIYSFMFIFSQSHCIQTYNHKNELFDANYAAGNCQFETDQGSIDLSVLDANPGPKWKDLTASSPTDFSTYSYNPCTPFDEGSCIGVAVCQSASFDQYPCGTHDTATLIQDTTKGIYIQYTSDERKSNVYLVCSESPAAFAVAGETASGSQLYEMTITGKEVCPSGGGGGGSGGGLSTGTVLCIVLIVVITVYLIAGSLFMFYGRGARGIEVVPNIEFWKDFPSLVKDGCRFVVNKIRGGSSSYESM